jgi:predicted ATPase
VFDIHKIQEEMMVSGTTADLLARKLLKVSMEMQRTLKLVSLIGYSLDSSLLIAVAGRLKAATADLLGCDSETLAQATVLKSLDNAVMEGFLERTHKGYQFTHDKVQSACQSMIKSEHEKQQLHFLIGEAFLANGCDGYSVYNAAVHWNCAPEFIQGSEQREKLARINFEAARHCQEKSAFAKAVVMLQIGLSVLDENEKWSANHFSLTYQMTERLAKLELIVGNFEACKKATKDILTRGTTTEMKINSLLIDVEARMTALDLDGAVVAAFNALQILAVKMPRKVSIVHVAWKLGIVKRMLWNKSNEDVLNLPVMQDKSMSAAVRILVHLCTYCLLNNKRNEAMYSALLAIQLTLKGGLSSYSANALAIYGVAEVALGNHAKGYRFGQLALTLLDRMRSKDAECATVGFTLTLLSFWREPLRDLHGRLFQAGTNGYETGDILYGESRIFDSILCVRR